MTIDPDVIAVMMFMYIVLTIVSVLMLVNLWQVVYEEAQERGGWMKLPWWVWSELLIGTPVLLYFVYVGVKQLS